MKNCILKGLCTFFMLLSLLTLFVPIAFAAQDGHGGSTEVIARIAAPTEQPPDTQPFTEPASQTDGTASSAGNGSPIQTGSSVLWIILSVACMAAALLLIYRLRSDSTHQPKSKHTLADKIDKA